ncbi:MAG: hypothetical protein ACKOJF_18345, partial [Planctomycetaceae bacterium]
SAARQSAAGGAAAGASGGGEASKPVTTDELLHPAEDAAFFEGWVAVRDNGRVSLLCAELSRLAYAPFTKIAAETRRIGLRDATPIGGPGKEPQPASGDAGARGGAGAAANSERSGAGSAGSGSAGSGSAGAGREEGERGGAEGGAVAKSQAEGIEGFWVRDVEREV